MIKVLVIGYLLLRRATPRSLWLYCSRITDLRHLVGICTLQNNISFHRKPMMLYYSSQFQKVRYHLGQAFPISRCGGQENAQTCSHYLSQRQTFCHLPPEDRGVATILENLHKCTKGYESLSLPSKEQREKFSYAAARPFKLRLIESCIK